MTQTETAQKFTKSPLPSMKVSYPIVWLPLNNIDYNNNANQKRLQSIIRSAYRLNTPLQGLAGNVSKAFDLFTIHLTAKLTLNLSGN